MAGDELAREVLEDLADRHAVLDAEGEVEVGQAVPGAGRQRADLCAGHDARVCLREAEHVLPKPVPAPRR